MKNIILWAILGLFLGAPNTAHAQILKKLKKKVEQKVEKEIDKTTDKEEEKDLKQVDSIQGIKKEPAQVVNNEVQQPTKAAELTLNWSKYDFVPGTKVIYDDNLVGEENGEFPARWDLIRGNVEIAEFGGENVIMFRDGAPTIVPYMKNASEDYLPDVFTIEFDLYCGKDNFVIYLFDRKNQKSGSPTGYTYFNIKFDRMEMGRSASRLPQENLEQRRWIHVAIAYTNGKLKGYIDQTRLINIPRIDFDPKGVSLHSYHCSNDNLYYVKNFRIAEGGVKYYDRVMQDGKIIANGIRFDTGKATLKPESMGIINEIVQMMQEHPELKFSVEGHTDSDGSDADNLALSEKRAHTVKSTMVQLGISADRLTTAGLGESAPIDTNGTPEGKANNRRVEFVKQ
ncbi:OmpA family protein [Maribacter polysaccharolyticus]|uniref:OmpA family protein n=1 Tax=Maribacter polysaccharolyticus TaxID=3020831 RepID=UPI00237FABDE|nr:OmpA family protein [Maribacter polysaccharolyticus]MDE3743874.1 OmpA family protein [Maribacter polysaccharolyticus]